MAISYIKIPDNYTNEAFYVASAHTHRLPFFFAIEEYVARHYQEGEFFMVWRVPPTVMLGRNQLIENEVDTDYCHTHNIDIFRRKSGGGCIYSDLGCLQFSYISAKKNISEAFTAYMQLVADVLRSVGIDAVLSGRNDILVEGKKVAGSAFYGMQNRCVLHNSLLYNTQLDHLNQALTPDKAKLQSKGVASVNQCVNNVSRHTNLDIFDFIAHTIQQVCGENSLTLTTKDLEEIDTLAHELASDDFVYGKNPKYTEVRKHRFPEVGTIEAHIELKNSKIVNINLIGDYFLLGDLDNDLLIPLRGIAFKREAVEKALKEIDTTQIIRNLKQSQLLRLLFGRKPHVKKPEWLKIDLTAKANTGETSDILHRHHIHTICTSGLCPNRAECWATRTATLMIGGEICTRKCKFCNTLTGKPLPLDANEPQRIADTIKALGLRYAVITSVDRDDLPDGGAAHWVNTIKAIQLTTPDVRIELLLPDFLGNREDLDLVLQTKPYVAGHNIETVRRLTPEVRSVAKYDRSLNVLQQITQSGIQAKTGLMLGLGETHEEVLETLNDVLATGCQRITIGQYLQPTAAHLPVAAYITPEAFANYKRIALKMGFKHVESGPLVRSSYHAAKSEEQT